METVNLWRLMLMGGVFMWPILLCSVLALAAIIDKFGYFYYLKKHTPRFLGDVLEKIKRHDIKEALDLCEKARLPLANILKAGLLRYDQPRSQIREAMEDSADYELPGLEKNLNILAIIFNILPLLGFLGSLTALARCFQAVGARIQGNDVVLAAGLILGIWEAFIPAISGLTLAILVFVAHAYFSGRVQSIARDIEMASSDFLNLITE